MAEVLFEILNSIVNFLLRIWKARSNKHKSSEWEMV